MPHTRSCIYTLGVAIELSFLVLCLRLDGPYKSHFKVVLVIIPTLWRFSKLELPFDNFSKIAEYIYHLHSEFFHTTPPPPKKQHTKNKRQQQKTNKKLLDDLHSKKQIKHILHTDTLELMHILTMYTLVQTDVKR